ncbi:hypothetical protein AGMMS50276_12910 [Synergistales bacterium]|nr:hypothetical protein AGMMS50276_12910 [Synergistales bacterium]
MPTYKNETDKRITFQDKPNLFWQPGEVNELEYFVPFRELGLTMTSAEPRVLTYDTRGIGYMEMIVSEGMPMIPFGRCSTHKQEKSKRIRVACSLTA